MLSLGRSALGLDGCCYMLQDKEILMKASSSLRHHFQTEVLWRDKSSIDADGGVRPDASS